MHPKIHMGSQGTSSSQNNLGKEQNGHLTFLNLKTHYKAVLIKIVDTGLTADQWKKTAKKTNQTKTSYTYIVS